MQGGAPEDAREPAADGDPVDAADDLTVDTAALVACPYCGAEVETTLDPGGAPVQEYVEDCEVCCRPWQLTVRWDPSGMAQVEARSDEE